MSNQRYDVLSVRKYKDRDGAEKTAWTNIGSAWEQKDGKGFNLSLHCVPAPDPERGEYKLVMRIPMPREDRGAAGGGRQRPAQQAGGIDGGSDSPADDDIPF